MGEKEGEVEVKKKFQHVTLVTALGLSSVLITPAYANTLEDLKEDKEQVQEQRSEVNDQIEATNQKINEIQAQQDSVEAEIKKIDLAMTETETKITEKGQEIDTTKAEIEKLKQEIVVLTDRINKRNELLKDRARNFQENGSVISYVDVLMGSKSFSDFIDRMSAVAAIVEADQDILREHRADKEELENAQKAVEEKLAGLEKMLADLEQMKVGLESQKAEKDQLMASLESQEQEAHDHQMELKEQEQVLARQQEALQKAVQLEQQRQAELARQQAAAAAAAAQGGTAPAAAPTPPVSDGAFTRPSAGTLTSGFGMRWGKLHAGVDLAARGTVPVVSAADGVVVDSYYSSSYGNVVFIAHSINGQTYTTVYAHLSSRAVGAGQVVNKGQFIGNMGNTGDSQGQHLHFELHRGGWNSKKTNAINPVGIVPL